MAKVWNKKWDLLSMCDVSEKWKLLSKFLSEILKAVCSRSVRTYLRQFGSGMWTTFIWLIIGGTTVPAIAMLSVRDTAIVNRKFNLNLNSAAAQCHWSYRPLCSFCVTKWQTSDPDRPAVWWPYWPEILQRVTASNVESVLRVQVLHGVKCNLQYLNGSSNVQITKQAVQCPVQNACLWSQP
jgi:hypothetical protein